MQSAGPVFSSIALGAAVVMFSTAWSFPNSTDQNVDLTLLQPAGAFEVPGASGGTFSRAEIGDGAVWFVTLRPDSVHVERTDGAGRVQNIIDLPSPGHPDGYCVSKGGSFGLKYGTGVTKVYSAAGDLLEEIGPNASRGIQCVFLDSGELVGVSGRELVQYKGGSVASIRPSRTVSSDAPIIALPLSRNRVGVIDTVDASLSVVGVQSEVIETIPLKAPDIQDVQRSPDMLALFSAVVDPNSHDVFAAVAPYNAFSGVVILRFSENGLLKGRFRCVWPIGAALKSDRNPSGRFLLQQIAVADHTLLLVSRSQAYCFYYKIPN